MTRLGDRIVDLERENAELRRQLEESRARQEAAAEVLSVINASPGDLAPVFDAILEKAVALCDSAHGHLYLYDGELIDTAAVRGDRQFADWMFGRKPFAPQQGTLIAEVYLDGKEIVQCDDATQYSAYQIFPGYTKLIDVGGIRSVLIVALCKDGRFLGSIALYRQEVRPYTARDVALLRSFAAQAVIAMENARLITETREALEQQTATAEVLGVINASPGDLAPVLDAMLDRAVRLCDGTQGIFWTYDGDRYQAVAFLGINAEFAAVLREPVCLPPESPLGRVVHGELFVQILDMADTEVYRAGFPLVRAVVDLGKVRSLVVVPLVKDATVAGIFAIARGEVRAFTDKQIALLQNFAAQAVIAMENARLLTETREALDQQTATAEVLGVINASPGDLAPVFDAMLEKAATLCGADEGVLRTFDGDLFHAVAAHGGDSGGLDSLRTLGPIRNAADSTLFGPLVRGEGVVHVFDVRETDTYRDKPEARARLDLRGVRTFLGVALRKEGILVGALLMHRREVRPFTDKQIALLQNFAAQAVIAMENARLLTETQKARDAAEAALTDLKAAQGRLIQAEKMASLGQLTAGIAHEIKNPLNFVNNFAALSNELLDELKEGAGPALAMLDDDKRAELDETMVLLSGNLEKIAEHGRRADNIVKSMLEHSRGVSGERREVDLNALVEEALNLAYHGARAQDPRFNIALERDLAADLKPIELVPQDITRVFLNLFGNGFYAAGKRAQAENGAGEKGVFRPVLRVATRAAGDAVEVRVRDNGTGIAPGVRDRLFQPFFTTKPTGEGTGLGLSISYDIVTQQHGGTIAVDSAEGEYTEFTIRLPRRAAPAAAGNGAG